MGIEISPDDDESVGSASVPQPRKRVVFLRQGQGKYLQPDKLWLQGSHQRAIIPYPFRNRTTRKLSRKLTATLPSRQSLFDDDDDDDVEWSEATWKEGDNPDGDFGSSSVSQPRRPSPNPSDSEAEPPLW